MASYFGTAMREIIKAHIFDVHLPNILIGVSASVEVPITTILGRRVGLPHSEMATYVTISSLSRTLTDIPWGVVVEFAGVRRVMVLSLLLNALAMLVGWCVAGRAMLAAYCGLSGLSLGGFFLSRHIFVAGIASRKYRGMLMSLLSGLLRWSHVVGPVAIALSASYTGDAANAFLLAIAATVGALACLCSTFRASYQEQIQSFASSVCPSDDDDPRQHQGAAGTELGTPAAPRPPDSRFVAGNEAIATDYLLSQPPPDARARAAAPDLSASLAAVTACGQPRPVLDGAADGTHFHMSALWGTFVEHWSVIWRLGVYVVSFGALRSNRKLMLTLAGMRESLSDADIGFLISFSFIFDALLFPLGGIMMDLLGRQYAMVPVVAGLTAVFLLLPLATTHAHLYAVAAGFGVADALGCGLVMTLTADKAPKLHGAPFFGIMRTLQDMGHLVGGGTVSVLLARTSFRTCCWVLVAQGVFTCAWGLWGVPPEAGIRDKHPSRRKPTAARQVDYGTV